MSWLKWITAKFIEHFDRDEIPSCSPKIAAVCEENHTWHVAVGFMTSERRCLFTIPETNKPKPLKIRRTRKGTKKVFQPGAMLVSERVYFWMGCFDWGWVEIFMITGVVSAFQKCLKYVHTEFLKFTDGGKHIFSTNFVRSRLRYHPLGGGPATLGHHISG